MAFVVMQSYPDAFLCMGSQLSIRSSGCLGFITVTSTTSVINVCKNDWCWWLCHCLNSAQNVAANRVPFLFLLFHSASTSSREPRIWVGPEPAHYTFGLSIKYMVNLHVSTWVLSTGPRAMTQVAHGLDPSLKHTLFPSPLLSLGLCHAISTSFRSELDGQ